MSNFTPLDYTHGEIFLTAENDYAYGTLTAKNQHTATTGLHFEISANTGYLDYLTLKPERYAHLFERFVSDIGKQIENDYIAGYLSDLDKLFSDKKWDITSLADIAEFISQLKNYRARGAGSKIEQRAYDEQIKRATEFFDTTLDRLRDYYDLHTGN